MNNGYRQDPDEYGRKYETFNIPSCISRNTQVGVKLGCGPSAFTGILLKKYKDGHSFFGKSYDNGRGVPTMDIARELTAPTGRVGKPLIVDYMGSCNLPDGTMTLASGFARGANRFLKDQGSELRLRYNYSHYAGNVWSARTKARILKQEIGENNNPVVAEYFRGFFKGHFSPVTEYRITYGITTGVKVRTMDDRRKWRSLSGIWGTERGVFYLE